MPTATATLSTRAALALCLLVSVVTAPLGSTQSLQDGRAQAQAVRGLLDDGRFSDAEQVASRLLPISSAEALDNSADLDVGDLLVEALVRNGRGGERQTRQIAELIVRARKTRVGLKHPSLATSVRNLGDVLLDAGEYDAALEHLREALSLRSATSQPSAPDHANDLVHLAQALAEIGKEEEALAAANGALDRQERGDSVNGVLLARTLRVRGGLYQRLAKYPEARADFQRAVDILEASHPTHPDKAAALTLLGYQLSVEGDLLRANELLTRAVSMATTTLRPDHPEIASAIGDLAANLQELGDLAASRVLREQAVDIAERVFGLEHPRVAIRLNNLANTCSLQGEYAAARRLYERAHTIYQTRFGPDHPGATTASFNLALLDSRLGDFRTARNGLQAVIASWQRVSGSSHPDVARAVAALAGVLAEEGLDRQAQRYFERALAIRERSLGPHHPYVARTVGAMASSLARLGEVSRASALAARAVRIYEASGAQEGLASALNSHAAIFAVGGNHAEAARAYERSLSIRLPLLGTAHPRVGETEIALAASRVHLNDARGALTGALRGDAINRNHSRLTLGYLSERQALDYAAERPKALDLALSLPLSEQQASEVLDAIVLGRSLVLDELAVRQRIAAGQRSELAPLWSELASARQRYANVVIRGPNEQRLEQHAALIEDARRAKEQAERKLAEQSAAFKSELERTEISLKDVRASLPPDTALISFVRFNRSAFDEKSNRSSAASARPTTAANSTAIPSYVAFVLRPEGDAPAVVDLGRADALDPLIARWRRELVAGITQPTTTAQETERALRATGLALRRKIWDPIAAHLQSVPRAYVVPDGAINLVSLTALPTARSRYLLDDGPVIHYLSAERDLVATDQTPSQTSRGLLAVGGPAFADGSAFAALSRPSVTNRAEARRKPPALANPTSSAPPSYRSGATNCASFQTLQFPALPGSRREVQEVAALWRDAGSQEPASQVLLGRDASERAMKRLAPGQSILHLATHGFFLGGECGPANDKTRSVGGLVTPGKPKAVSASTNTRRQELPENPLLLSGLAFAGANRRAAAGHDEDDGILTAEEVASLNLQGTEWAVLSACDTGLGEIKAGEGVFGLRRAFQIAGARTVIMSLWSVDDQATRLWMRALYDGRLNKNLNTADAVREASLTVLRARRARGQSTHPFYWAAFVAAGDWR